MTFRRPKRSGSGNRGDQPRFELAKRLPRAELTATAVLGGAALAVDPSLGFFTWAVGILLAINQMRAEAKLEQQFGHVNKLAEAMDLSEQCDIEQLRRLIDAYLRIPEPEFERVKDAVLASARDELVRLATQKSSGELSSGEYYRWLLPMIEEASPRSTIRALSLMMSCEWDDSEAERRFIEANIAAAERGVSVERIFVMPYSELARAVENPAVRAHLKDEEPSKLRGYLVDYDWLTRHDAPLASKLGDGFISFDDRVGLVDLHSIDGSARGAVTMLPGQLSKLRQVHDELLVHSKELSRDLVVPAGREATAIVPKEGGGTSLRSQAK